MSLKPFEPPLTLSKLKHQSSPPTRFFKGRFPEEAAPEECIASPESKWFQWRLKRLMDFVLAGLGLIILSPVFIIVMLLIYLDSPGPCFISQRRVGYLGKEFNFYKFRSMVIHADKQLLSLMSKNETNALMFKMKKDPRVTRVGYWLRRYSIDELPQLWNVLRGEMSLVGPRPPLPDEVRRYRKHYLKRLATLPGLTGYWQISGRSNIIDFGQVVFLDSQYIQNWSLWEDIMILVKTIPAVLSAKGAA